MTDTFRELCAELVHSWDVDGCDWKHEHQRRWEATVERARRALNAAPAPPAPAAEGEVADDVAALIPWLLEKAAMAANSDAPDAAGKLTLAAQLLGERQQPRPVPVTELLPGDDVVWWFAPEDEHDYGWWVFEPHGMERWPQPTHWLPATALPLPEAAP